VERAASLRDLARALRRLDAGDTIGVRFLRDGVEKVVEATVVAR
jgi:S1-C subfamily serine protease